MKPLTIEQKERVDKWARRFGLVAGVVGLGAYLAGFASGALEVELRGAIMAAYGVALVALSHTPWRSDLRRLRALPEPEESAP